MDTQKPGPETNREHGTKSPGHGAVWRTDSADGRGEGAHLLPTSRTTITQAALIVFVANVLIVAALYSRRVDVGGNLAMRLSARNSGKTSIPSCVVQGNAQARSTRCSVAATELPPFRAHDPRDWKYCSRQENFTGVQEEASPNPLDPDQGNQRFLLQREQKRFMLLIVIFNHPFYENIASIQSLYKQWFARLVFYGPIGHKGQGVIASPNIRSGFNQQIAIAQAMLDNPGFDGYWWIGDDVLLNYPFLFSKVDLRKVWMGRPSHPVSLVNGNTTWVHWRSPHGLRAMRNAYSCIRHEYRRRMFYAFGCYACVVFGGSDAGYVPGRLRSGFLELAFVLRDVMFEIAIPTMLRLIAPTADDVQFGANLVYIWGAVSAESKLDDIKLRWVSNTPLAHPVKFSIMAARNFARVQLASSHATHHFNSSVTCC